MCDVSERTLVFCDDGDMKELGIVSRSVPFLNMTFLYITCTIFLQMRDSIGGQQAPISRSGSARSFNTSYGRPPASPSPRPPRAQVIIRTSFDLHGMNDSF